MISPKQYCVGGMFKYVLFGIDLIGWIVFFPIRLFWNKKIENVKKILLIRLDNIGDMIVATPAIREIRRLNPKAQIDILIKKETLSIVKNNPNINNIIIADAPWQHRSGRNGIFGFSGFFFGKVMSRLRKERYDAVVEFHTDPRNILIAYLTGARYKIGHEVRGFGFLLTHIIPFDYEIHIINRHLSLVEPFGRYKLDQKLDLKIDPGIERNIKKMLLNKGLNEFIVINPGTGRVNKYWTEEGWAELSERLIKKYNIPVVATGGPADKFLCNLIKTKMKNKNGFVRLAGKFSLEETAAIIKQAKVFISPDTGPMHIAHALGVPQVALFGPINPKQWGYDNAKSKTIVNRIECSFCDKPYCKLKTEKIKCMIGITVEQVMEAVKKVWK